MRELMSGFEDEEFLAGTGVEFVHAEGMREGAEFIVAAHDGQERDLADVGEEILRGDGGVTGGVFGGTTGNGALETGIGAAEEVGLCSSHAVAEGSEAGSIDFGAGEEVVDGTAVIAGGLDVDLALSEIAFALLWTEVGVVEMIDGGVVINGDAVAVGLSVEGEDGVSGLEEGFANVSSGDVVVVGPPVFLGTRPTVEEQDAGEGALGAGRKLEISRD